MKKTLAILLLLVAIKNYGQQNLVGNNYITIAPDVKVNGINDDDTKDTQQFSMEMNTKFTVSRIVPDGLVIKCWRYDTSQGPGDIAAATRSVTAPATGRIRQKGAAEDTQHHTKGATPESSRSKLPVPYTHQKVVIAKWANDGEFIISVADLNASCKVYYGHASLFTWGVLTLPVKLRFGNASSVNNLPFRFEENLNLGLSAGYQYQLKGTHVQSINILGSASISRVSVDSTSFKSRQPGSGSQVAAFSFSTGVLYQYELFQVGIFVGWDVLGSNLEYQWRYRDAPWVGLGLGVSLFNANKSTPGTGTQ